MTLDPSTIVPVEDIDKALSLINDFFESGQLEEYRKDLKKWRHYVINEQQFKSRNGTRYVLTLYEENIQLISAAHLLINHIDELSPSVIITEELLSQNKQEGNVPPNLTRKEILNPLIVLTKFFKYYSEDKYKEILHEWLIRALSKNTLSETLSPKEIIDTYDNLRKLYSATWLIIQRFL